MLRLGRDLRKPVTMDGRLFWAFWFGMLSTGFALALLSVTFRWLTAFAFTLLIVTVAFWLIFTLSTARCDWSCHAARRNLASDKEGAGSVGKAIVVMFAAIGAYFFVTLVIAPAVGMAINIYDQWQSFVHFIQHPFGLFAAPALAVPLATKQKAVTPSIPGLAPRGLTSSELFHLGAAFFFLVAVELFLDIVLLPADEVIVPGELILDALLFISMVRAGGK